MMKKRKAWALEEINPGAYSGYDWTSEVLDSAFLSSYNPATEERIAEVSGCTTDDYDEVIRRAKTAFLAWRDIPAPERGDIIRQIGEMLRHNKDSLGTLVSLETGKSKQEGDDSPSIRRVIFEALLMASVRPGGPARWVLQLIMI